MRSSIMRGSIMRSSIVRPLLVFLILPLYALDLKTATIVAPSTLASPERKAAVMLSEEIEKRTRIRIPMSDKSGTGPNILLGHLSGPADGYRLKISGSTINITGNDPRGTLFGAGALLRHLHMDRDIVEAPDNLDLASAPKYPLRGHQLGYRPKTNSYDGWDVRQWEQYIRDLVVFGTNAIELIPPRSDDAADSPHFPLPPMQMMIEMSRIANEYGLDVWIWYPAMDKDYSDPKTVEFALKEWSDVFRQLPRIDAVFVPGGDPGHTEPKYLMALLEKQTENLHRYHPKAQMWVSPQSFNREWMDQFLGIVKQEPRWLSGIVFGPQIRMSLPDLRAAIPKRYPIRHYPDITHSRQSQYPVPDWDVAYAITEAREVINPRPMDEAAIFRYSAPYTNGFITYSEGCNDDVNKIVWSALGWNPDADVRQILVDYSRYFIGARYAENFADGLLKLEENWRGPLIDNPSAYTTLDHFTEMERAAPPQVLANWRFQQGLYRAYYDAYVRARFINESRQEEDAMNQLRKAREVDDIARTIVVGAHGALARAEEFSMPRWRARLFELAEALFQSIRMQLSVSRYKAISTDRGASLDTIDVPLNSRQWLEAKFTEILKLTDKEAQFRAIDEIVNWEDPGPGGFYDDLGDIRRQPHLVHGKSYAEDPAFLASPIVEFSYRPALRKSSWTSAGSLNDSPLRLHYDHLDRDADYKIRVIYAGDSPNIKIRLVANRLFEIHPLMQKPNPVKPIEFDIPKQATATGELNLEWTREQGLGGNGRGCQVSEIWLIKK
jgi:hypothetical protein